MAKVPGDPPPGVVDGLEEPAGSGEASGVGDGNPGVDGGVAPFALNFY